MSFFYKSSDKEVTNKCKKINTYTLYIFLAENILQNGYDP